MQKRRNMSEKNIRLDLMYDGTNYNGWQRLRGESKTKNTIQGLLELLLSQILEESIIIIGSGRTDAGVHALQQVCNFHTKQDITVIELQKELNLRLPSDVRVLKASEVPTNFHARYSAISKVYEYRIDTRERENVFTRGYVYPNYGMLDLEAMQRASRYLIGTHDFRAFSTDRKDGKPTIRRIQEINIYQVVGRNQSEIRIECKGDGFLHHMVRILAGTLLEVGNGERTADSILNVLESKKRSSAGKLLYPQGLFLKEVVYL